MNNIQSKLPIRVILTSSKFTTSEDGKFIDIIGARTGSKAYDMFGTQYVFTKEALESHHKTWMNGRITLNHMKKDAGTILSCDFNDPDTRMRLQLQNEKTISMMQTPAFSGFSQECEIEEVDEADEVGTKFNIKKFKGVGMSLLFYPIEPACSPEEGCKLLDNQKNQNQINQNQTLMPESIFSGKNDEVGTFGDYKDLDDCLSKNSDKKDPKAYCATIKRKIEDKQQSNGLLGAGMRHVAVPAAIEIIKAGNTATGTTGITVIPSTSWTSTSSSLNTCPGRLNNAIARSASAEAGSEATGNGGTKNSNVPRGDIMNDEECIKKCKEDNEKLKSETQRLESALKTLMSENATLTSANAVIKSEKEAQLKKVGELESASQAMKTALDSATTKLQEIETSAKKVKVAKIISMDKAQDEKILMSMTTEALTLLEDSIARFTSSRGPIFDAGGKSEANPGRTIGGFNPGTNKWE